MRILDEDGSPEANIDEQGRTGTGGIFTRSWAVENDEPAVLMKTLTVTITWVERDVNHKLEMTTVIGG
jgi:hypothetical protein